MSHRSLVHSGGVAVADGSPRQHRVSGEIFQLKTLNASETEKRRSDDVVPMEEE
jgi:hypothetical protein